MSHPILKNIKTNEDIPLVSGKFAIGRNLQNSLVLRDVSVSRTHCILENLNYQWILNDTSSNGTLVNNRKISKANPHYLSNGDIITIGTAFEYKFIDAEPSITDDDLMLCAIAVDESFSEPIVEETAQTIPEATQNANKKEENRTEEVAAKPSTTTDDIQIQQQQQQHKKDEAVEDELTCSICAELFVKAVTLSCSHTYCKLCISTWKSNNSVCPICRTKITTEFPTLVVDNFIAKFMETAEDEVKIHRKQLLAEREALEASEASTSKKKNVPHFLIEVSSGSSDDDDEMDYSDNSVSEWENENDEWNDGYDVFYGGYGRCFTCGQTGHWSNGCPNRRNRRANH